MKSVKGAHCNIQWNDTKEIGTGYYIKFSHDLGEEDEDDLDTFYYCKGEEDLKSLMVKGVEDFVVLKYELDEEDFEPSDDKRFDNMDGVVYE